jgi:DNA-binding CsgD family transcriptional regulator
MDEWAHGVLAVTLDGRLLHSNQAARNELARRGLAAAPARMHHCLGGEDAHCLQEALQKAGAGKRSLVSLALGQGAPLPIAVLPLKPQGGTRLAALVFSRACVCEPLMLCFFARSHRLTRTEELVLGILCQGYTAPEAARQLDVAVSTIRSHVRSLCAKTRANGVRDLVNRVARLPPVAPALRQEAMH